MPKSKPLVSVVVPAYNESKAVSPFFRELCKSLPERFEYEVIFVNDGSSDDTLERLTSLRAQDTRVRIISFSRNFGKEAATTAGINLSRGKAVIILDSDGQHPVELIDDFLKKWEEGAQMVVGIRDSNKGEGVIKRYGSLAFYRIFNSLTHQKLIPGSTDFRLVNSEVREAFRKLSEKNRITRALLDWVGFRREYIHFNAKERAHGEASYSTKKLIGLALNSFISLSLIPLYISVYLGAFITPSAFLLGVFVLFEQYIFNDPLGLNFTGTASLGILTVFLVGVILLSQGMSALYISRVYEEAKGRPLFVIDESNSYLDAA